MHARGPATRPPPTVAASPRPTTKISPSGSLLLPKAKRQHVSNLYAYCRTVDDLGDEAEGDRRALLEQWREDLERCYAGAPPTTL